MPAAALKATTPAIEQIQTYALDHSHEDQPMKIKYYQ
jgi:hypothetical protein